MLSTNKFVHSSHIRLIAYHKQCNDTLKCMFGHMSITKHVSFPADPGYKMPIHMGETNKQCDDAELEIEEERKCSA